MQGKEQSRRAFLIGGIGATLVSVGAYAEDALSESDTSATVGFLSVTAFGAKADGKTDDTASINAAIEACGKRQLKHLRFPAGTYRLTSTLKLLSGITYQADGPVILLMQEGDSPVMKTVGKMRGRTAIIGDFRLMGSRKPNNHGIVLSDYYSRIEGISVSNCGGHGILLSEVDSGDGSLVENIIKDCRITKAGLSAIRIGVRGNNKLTDGVLQNIIIRCDSDSPAVSIQSAAGWIIQNIHVYGKTSTAFSINNAYFTVLENLYVESYKKSAIDVSNLQTSISFLNVAIKAKESAAPVIKVAVDSAYANPTAAFSNVSVIYNGKAEITALDISPSIVHNAATLLVGGRSKTLVKV